MKSYLRSIFILVSCILFFSSVRSGNNDIIINEIGAYEASGFEWVEIYNRGETSADLSAWKFWEGNINHGLTLQQGEDSLLDPGELAIITQDDKKFLTQYPQVSSTIFDSSWGSLSKDGEEIGLKFGNGENDFVERFVYLATDNFSLERKDPKVDDYTSSNWVEHSGSSTVGLKNSNVVDLVTDIEPAPEAIPENLAPESRFVVSSSSVFVGATVLFDSVSSSVYSGSLISYSWNFGDGNFAEGMMVEHLFMSTGTFQVDLLVQDNFGSSSVTSTVLEVKDLGVLENKELEYILPMVSTTTSTIEISESNDLSKILINEFLPDPNDGKEWIELWNSGTSTVNLEGLTLSDGLTIIASPTTSIGPGEFFVVDLVSSKLNNDGDIIILKDKNEEVVDQVSYGIWGDGDKNNNAVLPSRGNTLVRINMLDSGSDMDDFKESSTATKGFQNVLTAPVSSEKVAVSKQVYSKKIPDLRGESSVISEKHFFPGDIVINELLTDPSDGQEEFVELYNHTSSGISLLGWKTQDGGGTNTVLEGFIPAHGFFLVEKPKGNLNNTGDRVILFDLNLQMIDAVSYGDWDDGNIFDNAPVSHDPMSLARKIDGKDSNNDLEDFIQTILVTAGSSNKIRSTQILDEQEKNAASKIFISEIFPNPTGDDSENEFIELYNPTTSSISLVGWGLGDDTEKKYFIEEKVIGPLSYAVFLRKVTGISLNNTGQETVKLFDAAGNMIDFVKYNESAKEEESFAKNEASVFMWTTTKTMGEKNIFTSSVENLEEILNKKTAPSSGTIIKTAAPKKVLGKKVVRPRELLISQIRDQDNGSLVMVKGIVASLPGMFASQYFYIVDGSSGVQIYLNKKNFPDFKIGDEISVTGEVSEAYGETRINAKIKENIKILGGNVELLPQEQEIVSIDESLDGAFVEIIGQVTELKTTGVYVDDGTAEIKVYFKSGTGLTKDSLSLGSTVEVRGIVSQNSTGYQILPRGAADIVLVDTKSIDDSTSVENKIFDAQFKKYFISGLLGVLIAIVIFCIKTFRNKLSDFFKRQGKRQEK